jgi:sugar phosphate isomerase/epimerase
MSNLYLNVDQCLELGVFAKTFRRPSVNEIFDTIAGHGLSCAQWNWSCVPGLPSLPESVPAEVLQSIRSAAASSGVNICAVSATFNLIEPKAFRMGLSRLPELARAANAIGCDQLTLCTGTRHPNDMWTYHPANRLPDAWNDMIDGLRQVSRIAQRYGIRLAIEPEAANVVCDAEAAERALQELGADGEILSIVLDAANLYRPPLDPREDGAIIDDAVAHLGERISLAHAKDVADPALAPTSGNDAEGYGHVAAGTGILPYPRYLEALLRTPKAIAAAANGKRLPLILHGLEEAQVPASIEFLRECMSAASAGVR